MTIQKHLRSDAMSAVNVDGLSAEELARLEAGLEKTRNEAYCVKADASVKTDANETAMFGRQLESIKPATFDVLYAQFKGRTVAPVASDTDPYAESIVYQSYDMVGEGKIVSNYADDLPLADMVASESVRKLVTIGAAYHYSFLDVGRMAKQGRPLPEGRAMAARRAVEQKLEKVIALGSAPHNIPGMTAYPNVPVVSTALPAWASATTSQILADIRALVSSITTGTQNVHTPNKILVPNSVMEILRFKLIDNTSMSILEWIQNPSGPIGLMVEAWEQFATAGVSSATRIMAGQFDASICRTEIPQELVVEAGQPDNLVVKFPMHLRTAGFVINYPLAFAYMDAR